MDRHPRKLRGLRNPTRTPCCNANFRAHVQDSAPAVTGVKVAMIRGMPSYSTPVLYNTEPLQ